ncbi:MAG: anhydro-N-acetylmuramic acid kinase [Verrucomicrobia bacterium]|nr:anhydro-N-acetylmuramic acid kinase [Verrucomicrobiota bacterium]
MRVLGIMSGTSLDGVDYALCDVNASGVKLRALWTVEFPSDLQGRLHAAARNEATSWETAQLHHDLGRFYADGARENPGKLKPQLVGLHGQTVFHNPSPKTPATFQLGEPAYLAEALRVPVVSNFRAADLAAGGQGAPLATLFHREVFAKRGQHVCVNNLGGISNVTSLDWQRRTMKQPHVLAFDTGPANVLLDMAVRHYTGGKLTFDENGAWARRGRPCAELARKWLSHEFFQRPPPKSTGREVFGEVFFQRAIAELKRLRATRYDALATFTQFTVGSIALNYWMHLPSPPDTVVLTGGGAVNGFLVESMRKQFEALAPRIRVVTSKQLGWPVKSIEPAAFALLAWRRWNGLPGNLPQTTGARRSVLCGQLSET